MAYARGWKSITQYCQLCRKSILDLHEEQDFPVKKIKGQWTARTEDIDLWFRTFDNTGITVRNST
jgi:hypothetical protein